MTNFQNQIVDILRACPTGLTTKEVADRLGGAQVRHVSSRLSKLAAYGIIGSVRGTLASHGTKGVVYIAHQPVAPCCGLEIPSI